MRRGLFAVGAAAVLVLTACAVPTAEERAHADAVSQAETSRRHLEALVPYDLAPLSSELARRALVRDGVLLSATGTDAEATVEARFTGVGWSASLQPTRTDLPVCFRLTRQGGSHDFQVTELDSCP